MLYGINKYKPLGAAQSVLILIFLENALRLFKIILISKLSSIVLILIFLENALRQSANIDLGGKFSKGLNPYFFGKCSTAFEKVYKCTQNYIVLILIFLENALRR